MTSQAERWRPVPDVAEGFGSIALQKGSADAAKHLRAVMHGTRRLSLVFSNVVAMRYEDDCPGFDPLPRPLPMLREGVTFPLLTVSNSEWRAQWIMHRDLVHYVLISADDLVQVVAGPNVEAQWLDPNAV
jgi:hypothetical protein